MKFQFLVMAIFLTTGSTSFAMGKEGGGGRGVVCRSSDGSLTSVELLDIWEARVIYGRNVQPSQLTLSLQVNTALERLKFSLAMPRANVDGIDYTPSEYFLKLSHEISDLFLNDSPSVRRLRGITLNPTPDADEPVSPKVGSGCSVEQIVNYVDSNHDPLILVNQDLFDSMDITNQAALIAHEVFYTMLRNYPRPEKTSIRVRRAVGFIFAGNQFPDKDRLLGESYVHCNSAGSADDGTLKTDSTYLNFYLDGQGRVKNISDYIFGEPSIGFFDASRGVGASLDQFVTNKFCEVNPNNPMFMQLSGWGPVDFTKRNTLVWSCEKGELRISITGTGEGSGKRQRLYCQMFKKS